MEIMKIPLYSECYKRVYKTKTLYLPLKTAKQVMVKSYYNGYVVIRKPYTVLFYDCLQ
jgi:hypothetical protein